MIVTDCAFEPRRYTGPVAPPLTLEDVSPGRKWDMGFVGTAQWARLVSGLQVVLLDGNSDYATGAYGNWRQEDVRGTILCWVKAPTVATGQTIFATSDTGSDTNFIQLRIAPNVGWLEIVQRDGGTLNQITGDVNVGGDIWHLCVVTGDTAGGAYVLYVDDGAALGLTVTSGANTGNWLDAVYNIRDNISVGAMDNTGTVQYFGGMLWAPRYYPYVFTAAQVWTLFNKERGWFGR